MKNLKYSKNFKNILLASVCVLIAGCANLVENEEDSTDRKAKVILQLEENNSRSVFAENFNAEDFENLKFYGKGPADSELKLLSSWSSYLDFCKSTREYSFSEGSHSFKFTAERNGVLFSQSLTQTVRSSETTVLKFSEMEIDSENTGKNGQVYINVAFPSSIHSETKKITAKLGSQDETELEMTESSSSTYDSSTYARVYTYWHKVTFSNKSVEEGNYLLTFKCYDENEKVIFTYPFYVFVKAGYTSSDYLNLSPESAKSSSEAPCKITYNSNYGDETENKIVEQVFYKGSAILNASQTGFSLEGKKIRCWTSNKDGTGSRYSLESQIEIASDITLYAVWVSENSFDVTYYSNPDDETEAKTFVCENVEFGTQNLKTLADAKFTTPANKKFMGWDTNQDGSGIRYESGESFKLSGDIKFYAQWCTYSSDEAAYSIGSNREFNAFFNAKENQTEIKLNAKLSADLTEPNFELTKNKTLSATFSGGDSTTSHSITLAKSENCSNLFKTISSSGKVEYLTIVGQKEKKSYTFYFVSYVESTGIFAEENYGALLGCVITDVVLVPPESKNAGGFAGKNSGNISACTITYLKISPSANVENAGGIVGYNTGTIDKENTISTVIFENKTYLNYYGQINGFNDNGTVNSEISASVSTAIAKTSYTVGSGNTSTVNTLYLERTAFVTLSVTDNSGGGAIYAYLYDSNNKTKISTGKVNGETGTRTVLLTKGTYTLKLTNENILSSSIGSYSVSLK